MIARKETIALTFSRRETDRAREANAINAQIDQQAQLPQSLRLHSKQSGEEGIYYISHSLRVRFWLVLQSERRIHTVISHQKYAYWHRVLQPGRTDVVSCLPRKKKKPLSNATLLLFLLLTGKKRLVNLSNKLLSLWVVDESNSWNHIRRW